MRCTFYEQIGDWGCGEKNCVVAGLFHEKSKIIWFFGLAAGSGEREKGTERQTRKVLDEKSKEIGV